jgi:hypothetical protein
LERLRRSVTGLPPKRRRWLLLVTAVVAALVLVGAGWWARALVSDAPATVPRAAPGTVQASVLTPDQVSALTGTTLVSGTGASEPPPPLSASPGNCAVAVGPTTRSVYARGWTAYLSATYQDPAAVPEHTVTQALGVYPDRDQARAVFSTLTKGVKECRTAVRSAEGRRTSKWSYAVGTATSDTLTWTSTQNSGGGWACYRKARLKGRTVLQASVCQAGDGKPAVTAIAARFAGKVSG